jgi:hypothetical protein
MTQERHQRMTEWVERQREAMTGKRIRLNEAEEIQCLYTFFCVHGQYAITLAPNLAKPYIVRLEKAAKVWNENSFIG